jgi:hypothetical protein
LTVLTISSKKRIEYVKKPVEKGTKTYYHR